MGERPLPELAREITAGAVRLAAATAAWLRLIAEFDRREGWSGHGIASCAHWLAWQCGLSPGAAREHVRVARALPALPLIGAAFDAGRLSYSKVRALTRIADESCEADLLEFALEATASQVERTVRQWRRADDVDTETVTARRQFDYWWDDDGMLVLHARLEAEEGAALLAAVNSLAERAARRDRARARRDAGGTGSSAPDPAPDDPAAQPDPAQPDRAQPDAAQPTVGPDQTGHDRTDHHQADQDRTGPDQANDPSDRDPSDRDQIIGLTEDEDEDEVALARERTTARRCAALASLAVAAADADRRAGDPPRREVVVHVDATVLGADTAAGRAYLEGGPALHPAQVRRMACQATAVVMLEAGREVLALGRRRRLATRAQRRALLRRDGGCARPGCPESRIERLHVHHMRHWLHGGRTDLSNLVLLCDRDHGLAHDLDLIMTRRDGRLIVTTPDGRSVWGPADTAYRHGLTGLDGCGPFSQDPARTGVVQSVHRTSAGRPHTPDRTSGQASGALTRVGSPEERQATVSALLFPRGEPDFSDTMPVTGERMDMAYVVGVLMGNRDLTRRLAAEAGLDIAADIDADVAA